MSGFWVKQVACVVEVGLDTDLNCIDEILEGGQGIGRGLGGGSVSKVLGVQVGGSEFDLLAPVFEGMWWCMLLMQRQRQEGP